MALFNCLPTLVGRKKKGKFGFQDDVEFSPEHVRGSNGVRTLQVKLKTPVETSELVESSSTPSNVPKISCCEVVEVLKNKIHEDKEVPEVAYEGEDEREDKSSMKRDISACDLQASVNSGKDVPQLGSEGSPDNSSQGLNEDSMNKSDKEASEESELIKSGHASDPGMSIEHWASPKLQRCCSSLDTREVLRKIVDQFPPSKNQSFEELQELANKTTEDGYLGSPCSHSSARTRRSADKVILKKHSYSQILPSRSKRLWWKLFLWSHRNLQQQQQLVGAKTRVSRFALLNQQGGYSSDTLEPSRVKKLSKEEPSSPFSEIHSYDGSGKAQKWEGFKDGVSGLWPQNQWVAFPGESSPLKRVDDWVKDLDIQSVTSSVEGETDNNIVFPPSPEANISVAKGSVYLSRHSKVNLSAELVHGNNVIRSLNASSTVAHISGMGLKIVPIMSQFSSLRSVNLSNNAIVQITHGSLPKGLHVLDLSRNKINTIEGLRELTRLRVLNLSFNRISRVGHGLSNCTLLKELYLCGNKISEVEGLHRLLKLTLLDLSFNKMTTTKALGQLVANYNSLLALNLLGNPIQGNLSEDQLRKAICGLLPKLAYLNKQPVNQQKAREVPMDIIAKASARSSSNWNARRKPAKKVVSQGGSLLSGSTTKGHASLARKSRNRVKSRTTDYSGSRMRA